MNKNCFFHVTGLLLLLAIKILKKKILLITIIASINVINGQPAESLIERDLKLNQGFQSWNAQLMMTTYLKKNGTSFDR